MPDSSVIDIETPHRTGVVAPPLLLRAADAAALCGKSERTWRCWDAAGLVPRPVRIRRATFWRPEELRRWVEAGCPDRLRWEQLRESLSS